MTHVELVTTELAVKIDPERGGVISSALARSAGVELLFQAPWAAGTLELADRDEEAWTTAWRGGWNNSLPERRRRLLDRRTKASLPRGRIDHAMGRS